MKRPIKALADNGTALAVCPEVFGGLPTPRERSEIIGGDGQDVLNKKARVLTVSGRDISQNFINGARRIIKLALKHKIKRAILKSKSPACGAGVIYDGTFTGRLKNGYGVLAALLSENGINVHTEESFPDGQRRILG